MKCSVNSCFIKTFTPLEIMFGSFYRERIITVNEKLDYFAFT